MSSADKVITVTPLLIELAPEDVDLLQKVVAARNVELADEGLSATAASVVRSWIRREARRRGMLPPLPGTGLPPNRSRIEELDDEASVRGAPVSATLPAVLAPPTPVTRPAAHAEPTMLSEGTEGNPLAAHPSLAPLPEDYAEPVPATRLDFPPESDPDRP